MADLTFTIVKHIAVLSVSKSGWKKELNLVSWNKREPKYDIREWDEEHKSMGKGITLSTEELDTLIDAYKG